MALIEDPQTNLHFPEINGYFATFNRILVHTLMRVKILRKLLIVLIMFAPVFTITDCRKQEKCGCDGDMLFTLTRQQAQVYFNETGTMIYFNLLGNPYSTYNFCNPTEMFPNLEDVKSGDILLVSGSAFWDCQFLYQSSNYSYYSSLYKVYQVQVTEVIADLYGKSKESKPE
jgi:hypothetical protein